MPVVKGAFPSLPPGLFVVDEGELIPYEELPPGWEKFKFTKELVVSGIPGSWFPRCTQPERQPMQYVFEVKIVTSEGYAVRRIMAPSIGNVVALLAEEDKEELADAEVRTLEVKRMEF